MQTERRKREIKTLHQQNAEVRIALRGLLELVLAIQENNPSLFLPSLNYNQRVMAAKDVLGDPNFKPIPESEGPSKTKLPASPDAGGGPIHEEVSRLDAENKLLRSKIVYVESLLDDGAFTLALEAVRAEYVK